MACLHLHIYRLRGWLGLVGLAVLLLSTVWLLVATLVRLLRLLGVVAALLARGRSCNPRSAEPILHIGATHPGEGSTAAGRRRRSSLCWT